jgi:hypothetical protein
MKFGYTGVFNGRTEFGSVECATMKDALARLAKNGVVVGHLYDEDDNCVFEAPALHPHPSTPGVRGASNQEHRQPGNRVKKHSWWRFW